MRIRLLVPALGVALVAVAPAQAASTFGSGLSSAPSTGFSGSTQVTQVQSVKPTASSVPAAAPQAGVLVEINFSHGPVGAAPGSFGFRLLSGADPNYTGRLIERVPDAFFQANTPAGITRVTPVDGVGRPRGVPVAAGDRLALFQANPTNIASNPSQSATATGATYSYFSGDSRDGVMHAFTPFPFAGFELLVQGVVEADADGDGYGDESQDSCPADPSGPCRSVVVPQIIEVPGPVEVRTVIRTVTVPATTKKRCRKGYKLKRKKCVKKKRRKKK